MISLFPQLFSYDFFAPTILRIMLGIIFIIYGFGKFMKPGMAEKIFFTAGIRPVKLWVKVIATLELISGLLLIIGFLTQLAAILTSLILIGAILKVRIKMGFMRGYDFELLLLVVSLSLLLLGPGAFAIDFPL